MLLMTYYQWCTGSPIRTPRSGSRSNSTGSGSDLDPFYKSLDRIGSDRPFTAVFPLRSDPGIYGIDLDLIKILNFKHTKVSSFCNSIDFFWHNVVFLQHNWMKKDTIQVIKSFFKLLKKVECLKWNANITDSGGFMRFMWAFNISDQDFDRSGSFRPGSGQIWYSYAWIGRIWYSQPRIWIGSGSDLDRI